jgi:hypothetical protein
MYTKKKPVNPFYADEKCFPSDRIVNLNTVLESTRLFQRSATYDRTEET